MQDADAGTMSACWECAAPTSQPLDDDLALCAAPTVRFRLCSACYRAVYIPLLARGTEGQEARDAPPRIWC